MGLFPSFFVYNEFNDSFGKIKKGVKNGKSDRILGEERAVEECHCEKG